jgi:hypothetical protein
MISAVTRSGTLLKTPWRGYRCLQRIRPLGIDSCVPPMHAANAPMRGTQWRAHGSNA